MTEYKCLIEFWRDDINIKTDTIIIIEEDTNVEDDFERNELIRDILLEKLKVEYQDDVELIEYETLTDKDYDIYQLTY